jgi:hypothetical protein
LIEHLSQNQVEDYCVKQLRSAELLSVSDHLQECGECRRRIECAMNGDAAFLAVRSEVFGEAEESSSPYPVRTHPTDEQTAGFVDGKLAGEELQMIADHLTHCEPCAVTVDDLRAFRIQIAPSLDREYRPTSVPGPTEGWWKRTLASLPAIFGRSPQLALSAAMTVLLLVMGGWLIWRASQEQEPKQEIAVAPAPPPQPAPSPVPVVAKLNDGDGQLTLDQEGNLSGADELPAAYQSLLKAALTNQQIAASSELKGLARPPSSLMSTDKQGDDFVVIEPVGRVVMTDRPTFRWSRLDGATSYVVEVYDSTFNLVATSPELAGQTWAATQSLSRGRIYSWQVKAIKDQHEIKSPRPPAPQAKFRILDQAKNSELTKAKQAYASSHLVLGLLYAEAGLLSEAEREMRALQKANPDSEIASRLLSRIEGMRRLRE